MSFSISLESGELTTRNLQFKNSDGTNKNITGLRVSLAIAKAVSTPPLLIKTSSASGGIVITDAVNGLATVTFVESDTGPDLGGTLKPGNYAASIWLDGTGVDEHIDSGNVSVTATVRRT